MAVDCIVYVHQYLEHNSFDPQKKKYEFKHSLWYKHIVCFVLRSNVLSLLQQQIKFKKWIRLSFGQAAQKFMKFKLNTFSVLRLHILYFLTLKINLLLIYQGQLKFINIHQMSKGRSYKNDTWASFDKQSFSLFKDDFVHDKLLTVKTGVQTKTGGVNLKQTLTNTNGTLASAGQTKLWFQLKNSRSLFAKIQHKALSLAYDHGIQEKDQRSFNWYGSVESNRNLQNFSWKAGVQIFKSSMSNNFLVQFNQDNRLLNLHHKALVKHNNWTFNSYKTLDLTNKVFKSAGFLVAHRRVVDQKNKDAFLRIENTNKDGLDLNSSSVHLDFVCNKQNVTSGLELVSSVGKLKQGLNPKGWIDSFSGAVQIKYPQNNTTFKLKVSSNLSAAISVKHALLGYGSYTWGVDMSEIGTKNNVRFGIQVDLNL